MFQSEISGLTHAQANVLVENVIFWFNVSNLQSSVLSLMKGVPEGKERADCAQQ